MKKRLQQFLIDDLKKVEHHVNEIIGNIYARQEKGYAKDIEEIEMFFSYWKRHAQFEKEQFIKKNWDEEHNSSIMFGVDNQQN